MSHLHHDPHGHGPGPAGGAPAAPQRWAWGEQFDVEIPGDWIVEAAPSPPEGTGRAGGAEQEHVHLVELYPVAKVSTVAHIALLEPAPPAEGTGGVEELVRTFAASRGAEAPAVEVEASAPGLVVARTSFDGDEGRWLVVAATWGAAGALMTACGHPEEAAHLDAARAIFDSLRVGATLRPLPPEETGSF